MIEPGSRSGAVARPRGVVSLLTAATAAAALIVAAGSTLSAQEAPPTPQDSASAVGATDATAEPGPFDWTLGSWSGVRRDAADGSEEPMTMRVEPILGGAGQARHLEIHHGGGVYRGFAVQLYDPGLERWVRQYANDVRGRFARLEAEVRHDAASEPITWRGASLNRSRESRLVSERLADDRWRRTMSISEDGGATWRALWIDTLQRDAS